MTNRRTFHYITDPSATSAEGDDKYVQYTFGFNLKEYEVESLDSFEDDLVMLAFPIRALQHIDSLLRHFGLNDNSYYFYQQVKDLCALPEKHQNEKGEGKIDFQVFFKNVPYSMMSINPNAIVLIALHPLEKTDSEGMKDYNLIGYIHANAFDFKPADGKSFPCYYYSLLRVSDKTVNGRDIYRRKRLFTLFFSVLNEICFINDVQFAYASMGRENVAINDALEKCADMAGIYHEFLPYKIFGQINRIWGSASSARKLVDITGDRDKLKRYYHRYRDLRGNTLFFQPETEEEFFSWVDNICGYSRSSRIYAIEKGGEVIAATFAINWADYFLMLVLNPKGLFKLVEYFKIIEAILFPVMTIGDPSDVRELYKGLAWKYMKENSCQVTFLPSHEGDPYYKVKKGLLDDDFNYFVICRDREALQHYKDVSRDADGNVWPFVEMPMT